ncbi:MAG TPA: hypothetical protein VKZ97_02505 [Flavobacteriaceae bacterium]|nr:hypothetical protein [Flavobacteriaceae bacterium]
MKHLQNLRLCVLILVLLSILSCSSNEASEPPVDNQDPDEVTDPLPLEPLDPGAGVFNFAYSQQGFSKSVDVYYFLPETYTASSPILFVFHGAGRNADEYRDAMVSKAQQFGFMIFAPEFSISEFPNGDAYNLGNVYVDGDNPSAQTLNPEHTWSYSIIDPLFDHIKTLTNNETDTYNAFGHSAGGQFLHRFLMFKPNSRVHKAVASASGWYTFPDETIPFPYGYDQSILIGSNLEELFTKQLVIQVGDDDDDPNSAGLRHNDYADAQGLNRKQRALNFFQFCSNLTSQAGLGFNWQLELVPNATHDFILPSEHAANLLYN